MTVPAELVIWLARALVVLAGISLCLAVDHLTGAAQ